MLRRLTGRAFHKVGAATLKDLSPNDWKGKEFNNSKLPSSPSTNKQTRTTNNNYYNQPCNSNILSQFAEKLCQAAYHTMTQGLLLVVGIIFCSVEIGSKQIMWYTRLKLSSFSLKKTIFTVSSSQITALLNSNNYSYNTYILKGKDYM